MHFYLRLALRKCTYCHPAGKGFNYMKGKGKMRWLKMQLRMRVMGSLWHQIEIMI